jgi:hypothetical protein
VYQLKSRLKREEGSGDVVVMIYFVWRCCHKLDAKIGGLFPRAQVPERRDRSKKKGNFDSINFS